MGNEPVAISVALGAVLSTGVALVALAWPPVKGNEAAVIAFGNAVIALGVALFARSKVTPV